MNRIQKCIHTAIWALVALIAVSCAPPRDYNYFQDFQVGDRLQVQMPLEIKLRPDDKITVLVTAQDPSISSMFRLTTGSGGGNSGNSSRYVIDNEGFINMPYLGKIHVAGLNRQEIQDLISEKIIENKYAKDPIVTVDYDDVYVIVLGDLGGRKINIDRDKFTILDALSLSGDLRNTSKRTNIKVIRDHYGTKVMHEVNLCSAKELYSSPVYYLQQGDLIYIDSTNMRKREGTVFGNSVVQPSFWIGLLSMAVSLANFLK